MNDRSLANLLVELDDELASKSDRVGLALDILDRVEARVPGVVLRSAATIQLRSLGCAVSASR